MYVGMYIPYINEAFKLQVLTSTTANCQKPTGIIELLRKNIQYKFHCGARNIFLRI